MTIEKRRELAKQPILWTGDLDDDCIAIWAGLTLRAEWMDEDYWWWSVSEIGKVENIDDSNNYEEQFLGGEVSRKKAEEVAIKHLRNLGIISN